MSEVCGAQSSSSSDAVHWIFKNKDHGKAAATASLGLITLWDVQGGLPLLDKYLYSKDPHVQAGCLLGIGLVNCCVMDEHDPAYALLYEAVTKVSACIVVPSSVLACDRPSDQNMTACHYFAFINRDGHPSAESL